MVTCHARLNGFEPSAGQLRAESLALDIMHETHSSISGRLSVCPSHILLSFVVFILSILFVRGDEVMVQDT